MNSFLFLALAHFLADFPLQGRWLAKAKKEQRWGVFLHGLVHFVVSVPLFYPMLEFKTTWVVLAVGALTHAGIDQTKMWLTKKHQLHLLLAYFLDQLFHLLILLLIAAYFLDPLIDEISMVLPKVFADPSIAGYLLILILSTYTYDITRWTYRTAQAPRHAEPYRRDYKMIVRNGFIVTVAFALYWVMR